MRHRIGSTFASLACLAAASWAGPAQAFDFELGGINFGVQGFVRHELAVSLSDECNYTNEAQDCFIGQTKTRDSTLLAGGVDTVTRGQTGENTWGRDDGPLNLFAFRGNLEVDAKISEKFQGFFKFRFFSEPDVGYGSYEGYQPNGSDEPNAAVWSNRFSDDPNFYEQDIFNGKAQRLEVSGDNWMLDIPSAYIDYYDGPLWIRIGQQQIAWGEMLFFRVLDVPNGLDLRRHFFFDFAAEEYADERVAAPGIRGSYRVTDNWEVELFAQMFQPSILPGENSPYDVVVNGFDLKHEDGMQDGAEFGKDWNYGMRVKGALGDFNFQFIAVNRRNPDGIIRWTLAEELAGNPDGTGGVGYFDETGTCSGIEWTTKAAAVRLNAATGAAQFNQTPGALGLALTGENDTDVAITQAFVDATNQFSSSLGQGCVRGAIHRDYPWEAVFGASVGYIVTSGNALLDQLVMRVEGTVTPNKKFTAIDAGPQSQIEETEYLLSLNLEKYQRLFREFPATFFVFQYLWKSESDLYGRHLSGNGGDSAHLAGYDGGDDNAHYFVFAFQQPFPNLIWRFDFNFLMDAKGGYFFQPGVRYKPGGNYAIEAFVNLFASDGGNDDIIETVEHLDEFGLRLTYQF